MPEAATIPSQTGSRVDPTLDAAALRALALLTPEPADWVLSKPGIDHDVAIIGAGQNGIALAFALRRLGVRKVTVVDAAAAGAAGVWRAPARMNVLRTPKSLVGPELGISELGFRHWYEARHGAEAYDTIGFIKRTDWADYLDWFRNITGVAPRYETRLTRIEPCGDHVAVHLVHNGEERVETAQKLILATGIVSFGGPSIPDEIAARLPRHAYSHTGDAIDFSQLAGKAVAVLGGAASAFDAAGTALEAGAEVHLFSRRDAVANHAPVRTRSYPGATKNYAQLKDADRWWFGLVLKRMGTTAPPEAIKRVLAQDDFSLHLGARWTNLRYENGKVRFSDNGHDFAFDHVIAGTGYRADPERQPEIQAIAPFIARWRDRYTPPTEQADDDLAAAPYLGPELQLLERTPGTAPYLSNIHVLNAAASLSFGRPIGDVPSMLDSLTTLSQAIVRDLFLADYDAYLEQARTPVPPSGYDPELYAASLWRANATAAE